MVSARVKVESLTAQEVHSLRSVAQSIDSGSPLHRVLNVLLEAQRQGIEVTLLSSENEYSPNDAAALLKMSRPHLRSFMKSGALPYRMKGSHHVIAHSDLMSFVARREQAAKDLAEALAKGRGLEDEVIDEVSPMSPAAMAELDEV